MEWDGGDMNLESLPAGGDGHEPYAERLLWDCFLNSQILNFQSRELSRNWASQIDVLA